MKKIVQTKCFGPYSIIHRNYEALYLSEKVSYGHDWTFLFTFWADKFVQNEIIVEREIDLLRKRLSPFDCSLLVASSDPLISEFRNWYKSKIFRNLIEIEDASVIGIALYLHSIGSEFVRHDLRNINERALRCVSVAIIENGNTIVEYSDWE